MSDYFIFMVMRLPLAKLPEACLKLKLMGYLPSWCPDFKGGKRRWLSYIRKLKARTTDYFLIKNNRLHVIFVQKSVTLLVEKNVNLTPTVHE